MKRKRCLFHLVIVSGLLTVMNTVFINTASADQLNYDAIAEKMVTHALNVQPGETVFITGQPSELDLLGALSVAANKAGGKTMILMNIREVNKRILMETPLEYLKMPSPFYIMLLRTADCVISTSSDNDPTLFSEAPEERLAAARQANLPLEDSYNHLKFRHVGLGQTGGIPTKAYAESQGADYEEMVTMFWQAVNTDYERMKKTGDKLKAVFKSGSHVHISSKAGTDLVCKIADIPARVNYGSTRDNPADFGPTYAWLPAGEVYTCVDTASAEGTVVVPKTTFRGNVIKNLKLVFSNGHLLRLSADENEDKVLDYFEQGTGAKDIFSIIDIGINPDSHLLPGSDYRSFEMAGMVSVGIGDNAWAGGDLISDIGLIYHLADVTLSVDENKLVDNGKLVISK